MSLRQQLVIARICLVAACAPLLAGCSLAFVHGPHPTISKPLLSGEPAPVRCTTSRLAPAADLAFGFSVTGVGSWYLFGYVVSGAGLSAGGNAISNSERDRWGQIGGVLALTGMVFASVASWGLKTIKKCQRAQADAADYRRWREAWQLTQQARTAAQANDCSRVAQLARHVIEVDRSIFDEVFARDPEIMKCAPKPPQPAANPLPDVPSPLPPTDPTTTVPSPP